VGHLAGRGGYSNGETAASGQLGLSETCPPRLAVCGHASRVVFCFALTLSWRPLKAGAGLVTASGRRSYCFDATAGSAVGSVAAVQTRVL